MTPEVKVALIKLVIALITIALAAIGIIFAYFYEGYLNRKADQDHIKFRMREIQMDTERGFNDHNP